MAGIATQISVHRPAMMIFFRPVCSTHSMTFGSCQAVQPAELERLMVDQHQRAVVRCKQGAEPRLGCVRSSHVLDLRELLTCWDTRDDRVCRSRLASATIA